jgi:predicted DNA-binding transcriptional regulator AlpA
VQNESLSTIRPDVEHACFEQAVAPSVDTRLLSAADLAQELGLNIRTIRRMDLDGRLPRAVRISRAVRWRRAEIAAWIRAGCPNREEWLWELD